MCIVPEPTMLTKAGCVVVGAHGLDTVQASMRQIWTGQNVNTDTYNSAVLLAQTLGADKKTAMQVGFTVDLAIPFAFSFAIGAQRVIAIRSGRIKIAEHESPSGSNVAGHTIDRHIGKTAEELFERLEKSPRLRSSSSFKNTRSAEIFISKVVRDNKNMISIWVKNIPPGMKAKTVLNGTFARQTGISVSRSSGKVEACYKVRIVLKFEYWNGKPFFILTAYPMV